MLKTAVANIDTGHPLDVHIGLDGHEILVTETHAHIFGLFKAVTRSSAGTTIITEPELDSSIVLIDLILTTDRVQTTTVTVRFTDGSNTINILYCECSDAPVNLAIPFGSRWQGWKNARLELVTTGVVTATAACGYMKIKEKFSLAYDNWDALR